MNSGGEKALAFNPHPARQSAWRRREKSKLRETVETLVGAVVLAVFIMVFVAQAFTIDGPSMQPTFVSGERILADKLSYRFRDPRRGEVVVFDPPIESDYYIKRIIGVPGDEILIRQGKLYVNGLLASDDYTTGPIPRDFGPIVVPEDSYFVLGDNRINSKDSRDASVGMVPKHAIIGRVILRYWPLSRTGIIQPATVIAAED